MGICANRVVVITGAGGGIGREHALEFARQGARVVVNDVTAPEPVVAEIVALGGEAVASRHDVSDFDDAGRLIATALESFGTLHAVVNNAGILRDRMLVNMDVTEWDAVVRVHLRGTFCVTRHAVSHWRSMDKAGKPVTAPRVVNTSSPSGLFGNVGQSNYGAAKAAIASFTVTAADELGRLGVGVNAIAPTALTDMTVGLQRYVDSVREGYERTGFDAGDPANIAPLAVFLASPHSVDITGRVFTVKGGEISVAETWVKGPRVNKQGRWNVSEIGEVLHGLVAQARPNSRIDGSPR